MARKKILLINGPNLNLLGYREPGIYGAETLGDIEARIVEEAMSHQFDVRAFQSNSEGELINSIHDAREWASGIIINPGAYTHYSIAIRDAISGVALPTIEIHISNVHAREEFRHKSLLSPVCVGVIAGFGTYGYSMALSALVNYLDEN